MADGHIHRWNGDNANGTQRERPIWGPDASSKRVRVSFRAVPRADLPPSEHVTVETMSHDGYWKWIAGPLKRGEVKLIAAEQVEDA